MQNNGTLGLALLLTLVATALYAYCCFLGLSFCLDGNMAISAFGVLLALVLLGFAMKKLVMSKMLRNAREGRRGELLSAACLMLIVAAGCPFLSKFLEMRDYSRHGVLEQNVSETIDNVKMIDSSYIAYADKRIKKMKRINKVYGKSLSRRLKPSGIDSIAKERREWLENISSPNIWNIYTARNIHQLTEAGTAWTEEYANMSAVIYRGEGDETKPFEHSGSTEKTAEFGHLVNDLHKPDWRGIIATLVCFVIMMSNYFVTRRPRTGKGGGN